MPRRAVVLLAVLLTVLSDVAVATADVTVGSADRPSGSTAAGTGTAGFVTQQGEAPGLSYRVAGGGRVIRWSVNTTGASAGTPVTLLVLRSNSSGGFTVVGTDAKSVPTPLPAAGVATFNIAAPIDVVAGDRLGLYQSSSTTVPSSFVGGSTPAANTTTGAPLASPPPPGASLSSASTSPSGVRLNVAAVVAPPRSDLSITQTAAPDPAEAGDLAQFEASVRNPSAAPVTATVTDEIPSGLTVVSAVSAGGACSVSGRSVTCPLGTVAADGTAPVLITVRSTDPGTYLNTMTVAGPFDDPNLGNNSAVARLNVVAESSPVGPGPTATPAPSVTPTPAASTPPADPTVPVAPSASAPASPLGAPGAPVAVAPGATSGDGPFKCLVPPLAGVPLKTARKVLALVRCRVGKLQRKRSRKFRKGSVIRTRPGRPATLALDSPITLVVSSGRPPRRR